MGMCLLHASFLAHFFLILKLYSAAVALAVNKQRYLCMDNTG